MLRGLRTLDRFPPFWNLVPEGKGAGVSGRLPPLAEFEANASCAPASRVLLPPNGHRSPFLHNSPWIVFLPVDFPAPLSPCFHPHSVCCFRRRCLLVFSIPGVLPSQ